MKKTLFTLALAAAASLAQAAPASPESIERLLVLTRVESLLDSIYASTEQMMRQSMRQTLGDRPLSADQQRVVDDLPGRFGKILRQEFNWSTLKPLYVRVYQESFEQSEIDGLIDFYASPTGQAFVAKMPMVMQKSMTLMQEQMRTIMPRMTREIDHALQDAKIPRQ